MMTGHITDIIYIYYIFAYRVYIISDIYIIFLRFVNNTIVNRLIYIYHNVYIYTLHIHYTYTLQAVSSGRTRQC